MQTQAQQHMAQYPARPTATPEILLKAGQEIEEELAQWGNWATQCHGLGKELARITDGPNMNGYELAKHLERMCVLTDIDAEAVEVLDDFGPTVDQLVTTLGKRWERTHKVQPPHPIGTVLTVGTITGICEYHPAAFLVKRPNDDSSARRVVEYENAITPQEQEARTVDVRTTALT